MMRTETTSASWDSLHGRTRLCAATRCIQDGDTLRRFEAEYYTLVVGALAMQQLVKGLAEVIRMVGHNAAVPT